jgi:hypothetical protein
MLGHTVFSFILLFSSTLSFAQTAGPTQQTKLPAKAGSAFLIPPLKMALTSDWKCTFYQEDWLCLNEKKPKPHVSGVIIRVSKKTADDELANYEFQLSNPKQLVLDGQRTMSTVKKVKRVNIHGLQWVEGVHVGSEIADWWTHYYSTTTGDVAVTVAISAHPDFYPAGIIEHTNMINSFQIQNAAKSSNILASVKNLTQSVLPPALQPYWGLVLVGTAAIVLIALAAIF